MIGRLLVVLLLAVASLAGCSSAPEPSPTATPPPTPPPPSASPNPFTANHYDDGMLAFDFPAQWNAERFRYPSSVSQLKATLSTEELRPPCVQSGSTTICRNAVAELSPGGVLISWWRWGLHRGAPGPDPTAGDLLHVGGRSARIHDAGDEGHCLNMQADQALRLEVPDPTLDGSWTVMDACLREPVDDARTAVDAMLASVTWFAPQPAFTVPVTSAEPAFGITVSVYDDTGLVLEAQEGTADPLTDQPTATVDGNGLVVRWTGGVCTTGPTIGLAQDAGRLLVLLEPGAGEPLGGSGSGAAVCPAVAVNFAVVLTLTETVAQDDVYLEVW